jgi:hypothetical protein
MHVVNLGNMVIERRQGKYAEEPRPEWQNHLAQK